MPPLFASGSFCYQAELPLSWHYRSSAHRPPTRQLLLSAEQPPSRGITAVMQTGVARTQGPFAFKDCLQAAELNYLGQRTHFCVRFGACIGRIFAVKTDWMNSMSGRETWAADAVRKLKAEHGRSYSYAITDRGTLLELELPELPWMPPEVVKVLRRWDTVAQEAGFRGLLRVQVAHPAWTEQLVGAACGEWIRLLAVCRSLAEFNAALETNGLRWLSISVVVKDDGDLLFAKGLAADDRNGHIGWLWDVPVVSKMGAGGRAEWMREQLVEQLVEQVRAEQKQAAEAEAGGSGDR
jgi:hypothetical protein